LVAYDEKKKEKGESYGSLVGKGKREILRV